MNASEKATLSEFARRIIERTTKTDIKIEEPTPPDKIKDFLSGERQLERILEIEKRQERLSRELSSTLNVIVSAVTRLENMVARIDGEIHDIQEQEELRVQAINETRNELNLSAVAFAEAATEKMETALEKVGHLLADYKKLTPIRAIGSQGGSEKND